MKYTNTFRPLFLYHASENQCFFDVITDADWLQNIVTVYENNIAFSMNVDALFESLQIPDENLGAAGPVPPMARSLAIACLC
jgi:hypothetical protein